MTQDSTVFSYSNLTQAPLAHVLVGSFGFLNHVIAIHSFLSYYLVFSEVEPFFFWNIFFSGLSGKTDFLKNGSLLLPRFLDVATLLPKILKEL